MSDWDKKEGGGNVKRMCGETYGVCERMEDTQVSEREKERESEHPVTLVLLDLMDLHC